MSSFKELQKQCKDSGLTPYYGRGVTRDFLLGLLAKANDEIVIAEKLPEEEVIPQIRLNLLINHLHSLIRRNLYNINVDLSTERFFEALGLGEGTLGLEERTLGTGTLGTSAIGTCAFYGKLAEEDGSIIATGDFSMVREEDTTLCISFFYIEDFLQIGNIVRVSKNKKELKKILHKRLNKEEIKLDGDRIVRLQTIKIEIEAFEESLIEVVVNKAYPYGVIVSFSFAA